MKENEVHADDPHAEALSVRLRRVERALLLVRDSVDALRASQAEPPKWITSRWRDLVYLLILLLMAFSGDVKGALGYAVGHVTGLPPVVSTPSVAPSPAPEHP